MREKATDNDVTQSRFDQLVELIGENDSHIVDKSFFFILQEQTGFVTARALHRSANGKNDDSGQIKNNVANKLVNLVCSATRKVGQPGNHPYLERFQVRELFVLTVIHLTQTLS